VIETKTGAAQNGSTIEKSDMKLVIKKLEISFIAGPAYIQNITIKNRA